MGRPRSVPRYRLHKPSGLAVVTLRKEDGGYRDVYLGSWNSPYSKAEYARIIGELAKPNPEPTTWKGEITVAAILDRFSTHAATYYRREDGSPTTEQKELRIVLNLLNEFYADCHAKDFGPLALKFLREKLIERGLSRSCINGRIRRIKAIFQWAASEELVDVSVHQALATVKGIAKGRTVAREPKKIKPIDPETIEATLPYLGRYLRGMVEVHRLCGGRPEDICRLKLIDIDRSDRVWVFQPDQHKNSYRDDVHTVVIGPKAQAILKEFYTCNIEDYLFSPARAVEEFNAARTKNRKTPRFPSHMANNESRKTKRPRRPPKACYTSHSYCYAIRRAIERANRDQCRNPKCDTSLPLIPHWTPNQLRHAVGTAVRARFGLEAAQVVLDHERADVTQIYAERDLALAKKVAWKMG